MKKRSVFVISVLVIIIGFGLGVIFTRSQKVPPNIKIAAVYIPVQENHMPVKMKHLFDAYQQYIKSVIKDASDGKIYFIMNNNQRIPWDSGKHSFKEKLDCPSLADMMSQTYPAGNDISIPPTFNLDPGRYRNQSFLKAVYGAKVEEVEHNLVKVSWMPKTMKKPTYVLFNSHNNAAKELQEVSDDLDKLPKSLKKYVTTLAGTFKWRKVADTNYLSAHSYGIAIDINTDYSDYWRWNNKDDIAW